MGETRKDKLQLIIRRFFLIITDIILINGSVILSLVMRFNVDFSAIEPQYIDSFKDTWIPFTIITLIIFWCFRMYHSLWQYASIAELYKIVEACIVAEGVHICLTAVTGEMLPRACYFMTGVFLVVAMCASRFMYRMLRTVIQEYRHTSEQVKIMIIGAGEAANVLMREIANSRYLDNSKVVCIIDDDAKKVGKYIRGVKIVGNRNQIKEYARYYDIDEIIFAIPSASQDTKREILNICKETNCNLKIIPGVYQMMDGEINVQDIRNVDVDDLLGRDPIKVDVESILGYVSGKTVLVTGGGGSIGSELCRQLVKHNPKCLIIFDIYENNLYNIELELRAKYPNLNIKGIIGSVRDKNKLEDLFKKYSPYLVFHAAAHKHVPLMEVSPLEAIKNNVLGTQNVADCADKFGTKRFILISTDKAVNPTNIMGASKRMCEMIIQAKNKVSKTEYAAVRFGNVLGSNGSVVPLFKKQIKEGGPVTVTHKEITRFFMTIPEAVGLVLQAMTYAKGGEVFVLDMGEPVKIYDLAVSLIKLSGLQPEVDIPIEITGLRPGEKLYEELLMSEEGLEHTKHNKIFVAEPLDIPAEEVTKRVEKLKEFVKTEDHTMEEIKRVVKQAVPTYVEAEEKNKKIINYKKEIEEIEARNNKKIIIAQEA